MSTDKRNRTEGNAARGLAINSFSPWGELREGAAAVPLETVPATLGFVLPPPGYLETVQRLCREHGAHLVLDEVQAGLGRSGRLWAFEHFGVVPDILVLGKGLSGGVYPLTAAVLREDLERVFHADPFIHISTFGGAEPGCLVAKRVLEISSAPGFLAHVNALAAAFRAGVEELAARHRGFLTGRQLGLLMGLELRDERCGTSSPTSSPTCGT